MYFLHANEIWEKYPELSPGVVLADGISREVDARPLIAKYQAAAEERLSAGAEGELPEIQAWRRAFGKMGLKPTQYRCASEALLRRFRKERTLPEIHPIIDLCNSISLAFAVPVAVFDVAKVTDYLQVRHAVGDERYLAFSGETENPDPGEVIFADAAGLAHARRWTNRQSRHSAVEDGTRAVLIVTEAMHEGGAESADEVTAALEDGIKELWGSSPRRGRLTRSAPRFEF